MRSVLALSVRSFETDGDPMTQPSDTPAMSTLCFDFDGVICDSVEESSITAWKQAKQLWPEVVTGDHWAPYLDSMRRLRPVIHTGYEQAPLIRLIAEGKLGTEEILANWSEILPDCLARWGADRDALLAGYGAVRDRWIAEDPEDWLGHHGFYAPVLAGLRDLARPFVVITTKSERFCARLLARAGIALPPERLFGNEAGTKPDVLAALQTEGRILHFVEDYLGTLERVAADPRLDRVRLYLADWGYNTDAMRARANTQPRIAVIDYGAFAALLADAG